MTRHRLSPTLSTVPRGRRSSGFTLVELIISIVVIGILAAVGSSMIADSFTTTRMVNAENASAGQARYALERLARDIREIKYSSDGGRYCIMAMTATQLVFFKPSGAYIGGCDTNSVIVTIDSSAPNLTLSYSPPGGVPSTLSNQVDTNGFQLLYFQQNGTTPATSDSDIAFVQITLAVKDPISGQSLSQRTRVALRNQ